MNSITQLLMNQVFKNNKCDNNNESIIIQSTSNAIFTTINRINNNECTIDSKKKENQDIEFQYEHFAEFVCNVFHRNKILFCTEYSRENMRFRCHSRYGKNRAFYDWMLVEYKDDKFYPCKLVACIPGCHNGFKGYNLIVQETYTKPIMVLCYLLITHFSQTSKDRCRLCTGSMICC